MKSPRQGKGFKARNLNDTRGRTGIERGKQIMATQNAVQSTADEAQHSPNAAVAHGEGVKATQTVTINKPRHELYQFWRKLDTLPNFMRHLVSVTVLDDKHSHWVAKAPLGQTVEWDAEIINDIENEVIAWKSTEDAQISNAGSVRFKDAPAGRGTIVTAEINYAPPAGLVGATVARLFGEEPQKQVYDDLRAFEQLMETGEVASTEGQPAGAGRKD